MLGQHLHSISPPATTGPVLDRTVQCVPLLGNLHVSGALHCGLHYLLPGLQYPQYTAS